MSVKSFAAFGIQAKPKSFIGKKVDIEDIFNMPIVVHDFKIGPSKFEGKGRCIQLQISIDEKMHVVFNGSEILMQMISEVPPLGFPFATIIIKENKCYKFT